MALNFPDTPADGDIYEHYKYNATTDVWDLNLPEYIPVYDFEYLVIGGGAGGNNGVNAVVYGAGGAAGIARTDTISLIPDTYTVTIGAGSPGTQGSVTAGGSSVFVATATGGFSHLNDGEGGDNDDYVGGVRSGVSSGGGAGAGGNGSGKTGGTGFTSSITGSSVIRGGGGAGGDGGTAGTGGGGTWAGGNGTANTGSGGSGSPVSENGGNGGSGVVIIKYPDTASLTIGAGLTSSTTASGGYKVTTFTAGSDTITVS